MPGTQHPYAYALNNPLRYTDPSGEFVGALLAATAFSAIVGGGFAAYNYLHTQPCVRLGDVIHSPDFWKTVGIGALTGALGGLIGFGVGAVGIAALAPWVGGYNSQVGC